MASQEYECRRCLTRFESKVPDCFGIDPRCSNCGSTSVDSTDGMADELDVLRTKGAGGGC